VSGFPFYKTSKALPAVNIAAPNAIAREKEEAGTQGLAAVP
jgi:hypothetical protein